MKKSITAPGEERATRFSKFSRADLEQLVAEWDTWSEVNLGRLGIPYSELWRRAKNAREHPETCIPHAEVMRQLREQIAESPDV